MNTEIRYTGYCNLSDLPVREGDEITLPKGTPYTYRGELRETGRKTRVKVNHVLEGSDLVVGYYQRTSGHYHLGCASEADMHLVRKLYGTDNLEELWPRMRVSGDIHATIRLPLSNPEVCWAGSGGYWASVDINLVPSTAK